MSTTFKCIATGQTTTKKQQQIAPTMESTVAKLGTRNAIKTAKKSKKGKKVTFATFFEV